MKRILYYLAMMTLVLGAGCSSINLNSARELAETGSSASLKISEAYGKRADDLENYLEGENILAALKPGYSIPDKATTAAVDSITAEMLKRQEIFNDLVKTYEAFAELAVYDESEKIGTSIRDLTSAVNEYSKMNKQQVYFTQPQEDLAAIAGTQLFEKYHQLKVKKASEMIRRRLEAISELLTARSESAAIAAMDKELDRNRLKVALALWQEKLGLPTEIIAQHIETYGLQVNSKETLKQIERATEGKMQQAIENVLRFRNERQIRKRQQAYQAAIQSIQSLILAHRQFEKGEKISLESLHSFLQKMNQYADIAKTMKEED